ncbi:hypothetical protein [Winogradskya humida]|uniref:Uncharacterized protein n=1 Tax=Winogradskya humida TaxID=113566 RepID=A0ABQ3ZYC2_9ACTN|nr:hypothetical protein [Actinoplanes humidus]GIE23590.1 hypothetical protein Ahu01nite_066920 [Actinoplanes humidus]
MAKGHLDTRSYGATLELSGHGLTVEVKRPADVVRRADITGPGRRAGAGGPGPAAERDI